MENRSDEEHEAVELDPESDVTLKVSDPDLPTWIEFRVSSILLSHASPVFAAMFKGHFREGRAVRRGDCPTMELEEDLEAMEFVLRVIHFKATGIFEPDYRMNRELIAHVAIICDKYSCCQALSFVRSLWLEDRDIEDLEGDSWGQVLIAGFRFNLHGWSMDTFLAKAAMRMAPGSIIKMKQDKFVSLHTGTLVDDILGLSINTMTFIMQKVHELLDQLNSHYEERTGSQCPRCYAFAPRANVDSNSYCPFCSTGATKFSLVTSACRRGSRIATLTMILWQCGLWPVLTIESIDSVQEVCQRLSEQYARLQSRHICEGISSARVSSSSPGNCPAPSQSCVLVAAFKGMVDEVNAMRKEVETSNGVAYDQLLQIRGARVHGYRRYG